MKKLFKCCFPNTVEDLGIKDLVANTNNHTNDLTQSNIAGTQLDNKDGSSPVNNHHTNPNLQSVDIVKNGSDLNLDFHLIENNNKDDPITLIGINKSITDEEITLAPHLILEETQGNILPMKRIEIFPSGYPHGRGLKDGVTIFGISQTQSQSLSPSHSHHSHHSQSVSLSNTINNSNGNNRFDILIHCNHDSLRSYPYIFVIYFNKDTMQYYIRSYQAPEKSNRILFIKLDMNYQLSIENTEIISAGNALFQMTLINNLSGGSSSSCDKKRLEITDMTTDGNIKRVFDPDNDKENVVMIGRDKNCTYAFLNNKSFSRIQCIVKYNKLANRWIISDGNGEKPSTNGTWIFGTHSFAIKDKMIIEILSSKLKLSVINPNASKKNSDENNNNS